MVGVGALEVKLHRLTFGDTNLVGEEPEALGDNADNDGRGLRGDRRLGIDAGVSMPNAVNISRSPYCSSRVTLVIPLEPPAETDTQCAWSCDRVTPVVLYRVVDFHGQSGSG